MGSLVTKIEGFQWKMNSGTPPSPPNKAILTGKWANFKYILEGLIIGFRNFTTIVLKSFSAIMNFHMIPQVGWAFKSFYTILAPIRFGGIMKDHMIFQAGRAFKTFLTTILNFHMALPSSWFGF